MTENENSPENLRKFLESDDPALVWMGLSMAKGSGIPEDLFPKILKFYMWDDDKTIRDAAKSVFMEHAPADIQKKVKENWKASYRTLTIIGRENCRMGDKYHEIAKRFLIAFKSQDDFALIAIEPLIKALSNGDAWDQGNIARALGNIGDKRAVEPLLKAIEVNMQEDFSKFYVDELKSKLREAELPVSGKKAELIERLEKQRIRKYSARALITAAEALGKIGDKRAVEPLITVLEYNLDQGGEGACMVIKALENIGDKRAVEPLIKALGKGNHWSDTFSLLPNFHSIRRASTADRKYYPKWYFEGYCSVSKFAREALKKLGHEVK